MTAEGRARVSAFFRGRPKTPEHLAKMSEGLRRAWAKKDPEERKAIAEKAAARQRGRKLGPMSEETKRKIGEAQRRAWASGRRSSTRNGMD